MQHSIANSNAAFSCIGKVRCLHLTVNSQWKMTYFTRTKWTATWESGCSIHLRPYGLRCLNWSSPYGLDQYTSWALQPKMYALQALRPEVQKEKKYASSRPYGLEDAFKHISGLTAWDVYAFRALRPEMQKGQALRPGRWIKKKSILTFSLEKKK